MKFDRLNDMEQYIMQSGKSSLEDLCRYYDVSMSTVRRDVSELIRRKKVQKIYGGVVRGAQETSGEHPSSWAAEQNPARNPMGLLAASLVHEGMSIFLDSGAAALDLLPYIAEKRDITIISHSLLVLTEAARYHSLNVIALGGIYNSSTASFSGKSALDELAKMSIDLVFMTADGLTLERGLTSSDYTEVEVKKNVAKWNRDLVLLAEHSVFGRSALITFCEIGRLRAIISDRPIPQEFAKANALRRTLLLTPTQTQEETEMESDCPSTIHNLVWSN